MNRNHIAITIVIAIVCLFAGYFLALPGQKVVAPSAGTTVSVISIADAASSQIYKISGEYPQFANASTSFNAAIANYVQSNLAQFKTDAQVNAKARLDTMPAGTKNTLPAQSFTFSASWEPEQINGHYISIIVRLDYFNGGANGNSLLQTFDYNVATGKIMTLADLFPGVSNYLQQVSQISIQELQNSLATASGESSLDPITLGMLQSGAAPTASNYADFTFNDDIVTIYFSKYQVAPGVFGEQKVTIARITIR